MPTNITDVATYTATIQTVADGDAATGANFAIAPQGLANRTAYLNAILNTTGVTMIRSGTASAMAALTPLVNGSLFYATDLGGIYKYNSGSGATADALTVIAAAPGGRWLHTLQPVANTSPGVAMIGVGGASAGRIKASTVPNGVVAVTDLATPAGDSLVNTTTYTDLTNFSVALTVAVGDIVLIDASIQGAMDSGSGYMKLRVVDGATNTDVHEFIITSTVSDFRSVTRKYTVLNAGTLTIKIQGKTDATKTLQYASVGSGIRAVQIRP